MRIRLVGAIRLMRGLASIGAAPAVVASTAMMLAVARLTLAVLSTAALPLAVLPAAGLAAARLTATSLAATRLVHAAFERFVAAVVIVAAPALAAEPAAIRTFALVAMLGPELLLRRHDDAVVVLGVLEIALRRDNVAG
jgi:hypothetical protein